MRRMEFIRLVHVSCKESFLVFYCSDFSWSECRCETGRDPSIRVENLGWIFEVVELFSDKKE